MKETFGNKFELVADLSFDPSTLKTETDVKAALLKGQVTKEEADKLIENLKQVNSSDNGETKE